MAEFIAPTAGAGPTASTPRQWAATLTTYAGPVVGSKPVDEIATEDVLQVLTPIWNTKTETAKRVQGRIENVLDFAAARKWRDPVEPRALAWAPGQAAAQARRG